jgi:prepilin-type N-terminal cleavage/methylation domain-containing protein
VETFMLNSHSQAISLRRQPDSGFSMLEMIVALLILTVGLLSLASAIGYALMVSNSGRGITNAKLLVVSALEQMETLRDSNQLNFAEISAVQQPLPSTFKGFPTTFLPISLTPGPDFVYGTADDPGVLTPTAATALPGVERQVLITDISTTLKLIKVTLRYSPNGRTKPMPAGMCENLSALPGGLDLSRGDRETRCLSCVSYLNDDAHGNYVP